MVVIETKNNIIDISYEDKNIVAIFNSFIKDKHFNVKVAHNGVFKYNFKLNNIDKNNFSNDLLTICENVFKINKNDIKNELYKNIEKLYSYNAIVNE